MGQLHAELTSSRQQGRLGIGMIATIIIVALFGGSVLMVQYRQLEQNDGVFEEAVSMRNGVIALLDVVRVYDAYEKAVEHGTLEGAAGEKLAAAVDYLYVRTEVLRKGNEGAPDHHTDQLLRHLDEILQRMDAALSGALDIHVATRILNTGNTQTIDAITQFYEEQKKHHIQAMARQEDLLERMLMTVLALIAVLAVIAIASVHLWRREVVSRAERKSAEDRARELAYFDTLTGLPNRASFLERAAHSLAVNDAPALFLIDLDEFKVVNDTHGHQAGDKLLSIVAQRCRAIFEGQGGFAARLGGDEFAAILPVAGTYRDLHTFAEGLVAAMAVPAEEMGIVFVPKVSVGVATPGMLNENVPDLDALVRAADYALYKAKADGRFTSRVYDADMADMLERRRQIKQDMPMALKNGEFFVEFQPQIMLASSTLRGFEALVRWRRDGAVVPPGSFVDIAEEDDFITQLDAWVLRRALAEAVVWNRSSVRPVTISVNLSARNFRKPDIFQTIRQILNASGLPPELLTLEITESVLIDDWVSTLDTLDRLSSLGLNIALDDFGTGYSSLSYLRRLCVQEIKIDRAFVVDLEVSDRTRMMLDALVDIAKGLNMLLTIEGIETVGQAQIVEALGVDIGQGFLFSQPVDSATARKIVTMPYDLVPAPERAATG